MDHSFFGDRRARFSTNGHAPTAADARSQVSLVLPALNEAEGLALILPRVPAVVDQVIVVNGPSTDGTAEVVRRLRPDALLVSQRGRGKGNALKHGLAVADGDIIVTMDADGSMNPEDIDAFIARLREGADFVKGSRALPGAGSADFTPVRRAGNAALTRFANSLFGASYTDITYGFNAYWRSTIRHLGRLADGFEFEIQAAVRAVVVGMRTAEVATHEPARAGGVSKLNPLTDGSAILKILLREASPRRAVELGAAYEAAEQREREALRLALMSQATYPPFMNASMPEGHRPRITVGRERRRFNLPAGARSARSKSR
jgi:glycosyltransferase involved in cell wall biosynthesis